MAHSRKPLWNWLFVFTLVVASRARFDREVQSLDRDWRFKIVPHLPTAGCPAKTFPIELEGKRCHGFHEQGRPEDGGPASAEACRDLCCEDDTCGGWQWCPLHTMCEPATSCWILDSAVVEIQNCSQSSGWHGAARLGIPPSPVIGSRCKLHECQPSFDDSSWRRLDVPHDFVVEGNFTMSADMSHGFLPYASGWYRKKFNMSTYANFRQRSVWLDFEGVMVSCRVWLNGVYLGNHSNGYTPFRFNLSNLRWTSENVLVVWVEAIKPDSWWYDGGGIYRHVWLTIAHMVHISQWGIYAPAVVTGDIDSDTAEADAELRPSVTIDNDGSSEVNVSISCTVRGENGGIIGVTTSAAITFKMNSSLTIVPPSIQMRKAHLWTLARPTLYTLVATLSMILPSGEMVPIDEELVTFGVRSLHWTAENGFELNGIHTKILGCANHQDFPAVGVAVPDSLQAYRIRKLKEFGANAWRTAHNAPNVALLDAADRLGMLVWNENHRNGRDDEMALLVRRDRNHPSVFLWSICNEALCRTDDSIGDAARLKKIVEKLDPLMGRVVSANENLFNGPDSVLDVQGFDYGTDEYDALHKLAPAIPAIGSEVSSAVSDRGEYINDNVTGHVSGFDSNAPSWGATAEVAWEAILTRPFISGGFTWTGWDYRGEPTPYAWPDINSHFGIIDAIGLWKDRTFWYHAWWTRPKPPLLYIFPHWTWSVDSCVGACRIVNGSLFLDIWAYSNAEEVELWLPNGSSLGRRSMKNYSHAQWSRVPYMRGTLTGSAYVGGEQATTARLTSAGEAKAIRLSLQNEAEWVSCGSEDAVAVVLAEVVDADERVLPTANHSVTFSALGASIVGTGNGDPACHTPNTSPSRPAFNGKLLSIVRLSCMSDAAVVSATALGLVSGQLRLPPRSTHQIAEWEEQLIL